MGGMFSGTNIFNHLLNSWDVSNVTDHEDFMTDSGADNTEPNWNDAP